MRIKLFVALVASLSFAQNALALSASSPHQSSAKSAPAVTEPSAEPKKSGLSAKRKAPKNEVTLAKAPEEAAKLADPKKSAKQRKENAKAQKLAKQAKQATAKAKANPKIAKAKPKATQAAAPVTDSTAAPAAASTTAPAPKAAAADKPRSKLSARSNRRHQQPQRLAMNEPAMAAATTLAMSHQAPESTPPSEQETAAIEAQAQNKAVPVRHKRHKRAHQSTHHPMAANYHRHPPAITRQTPYSASCNFLAGATIGYSQQREKFTTNFATTLPFLSPGSEVPIPSIPLVFADNEQTITDNGAILGLLAGWQVRNRRCLMGIEGSVDFVSYEQLRPFTFTELQTGTGVFRGNALYDSGPAMALTSRAGYFITPFFLTYLRAGVQLSHDEVQYQVTFSRPPANPALPTIPQFDYSSQKQYIWGYLMGAGIEIPTYIGASSLRFEYNYVRKQSMVVNDSNLPLVGTHKFHSPDENVGKVSWIWNFL